MDDSDPWSSEFAAARELANSSIGSRVWGDGNISHREYLEVVREIEVCALKVGVAFEVEHFEGLAVYSSSDIADVTVLDDCEAGDLGAIKALYESRQKDPLQQGEVKAQLDCLVTSGVAKEGSSLDEAIDEAQSAGASSAVSTVTACLYDPGDLYQEPGGSMS